MPARKPVSEEPNAAAATHPPELDRPGLRDLEQRLLDAGAQMLSESQLGDQARLLTHLRANGGAVRISGRLYAHPSIARRVHEEIISLLSAKGPMTLAGVRDALGVSRKSVQAFLEHLDAARVTKRLPDNRRVLSKRRAPERHGR